MKRVLIIQSRGNEQSFLRERETFEKVLGEHAQLTFVSSLDDSLRWDMPESFAEIHDAVIIGGSGDFDFDGGRHEEDYGRKVSREIKERLQPLVAHAIATHFPLLGICYGHQIIGEIHDARVVHDHMQKKIGSHKVQLTEAGKEDALIQHLPHEFFAQYGHKDSLSAIPKEATLLAHGDSCQASILRYGTRTYTTQFHPELTHEELVNKLRHAPGYLPEGIDITSLVQPSPEASLLVTRFLHLV